MWELDHKEGWLLKNWCFWAVVLEKTLESPLDCKEIKPVNPKGNQPRIFIGRTDAEAEAPILWPPDAKSWLIRKDPGKDWRQEEKGTTEEWDGWMASLTWWTWVWASSRRWWRTGNPGVLQSMGLQRVRHDWATEQQALEQQWEGKARFSFEGVFWMWLYLKADAFSNKAPLAFLRNISTGRWGTPSMFPSTRVFSGFPRWL